MSISSITLDMTDVFAVGALVLAGYAAVWGIKVVIGIAKK